MNHDATHCFNYDKKKCPKKCYRAQLTEDLHRVHYSLPTSFAHFKYTSHCPRWPTKPSNEKESSECIHGIGREA